MLKRVILKMGKSDSLLPNFLVPVGGLFVTVPKWFGCLSFLGLAWAIGLPAARRNTCSWPCGVQMFMQLRWKPDMVKED